jgi:hypothetical protein
VKPTVRRALRDVDAEIVRLELRRDAFDRSIARLRKVSAYLRGATAPAGSVTSACRAVLRTAGGGVSPLDVRRELTANGFDWSGFTNPMSAVHTVLKRLVRQGEASVRTATDGSRRYEWKQAVGTSASGSQAAEADRIEHLLDGTVSTREFVEILNRWRAGGASGTPLAVVTRR